MKIFSNSQLNGRYLTKFCKLDADCKALLKQAFDNAQKKYQEEQDKFTALKGQVEQLEAQLKDAKTINTDELQEKIDTLEAERTDLNNKKSSVDSRVVSNKNALENINEHSQELSVIQEKYAYVSALSKNQA